ncbi:GNAT family N-acetyltransferase [Brevibacterium litoralis]|uniref:GNAT family N-acetyltransferase n=1 Tax=Brevibacterium litoralis TaxID=3138935 RepID=UPI0032EE323C
MLDSLAVPTPLPGVDVDVTVRRAAEEDIDAIVGFLGADPVSSGRGDGNVEDNGPLYRAAFHAILADPGNDLVVLDETESGEMIGTLQLTLIPGMTRRGTTRLLIEGVHLSGEHHSRGLGTAFMRWVTDVAAPELGAGLVQLTSDSARVDAHRFYERLGFVGSHVGFKYPVPERGTAPGT